MNGHGSEMALRVGGPLLVAAIIALFGYSATRAGSDDLERMREESKTTEREISQEIRSLEDRISERLDALEETVTDGRIQDARFQSAVRSTLDIPDGD